MSKLVVFLLLVLGLVEYSIQQASNEDKYYIAAATEYSPVLDPNVSPADKIRLNLAAYLKLIKEAKEANVHILVLPEATLNYEGILTRPEILEHAFELPDSRPKINFQYSDVLKQLSSTVKEANIYTVINVVEKHFCKGEDNCPEDDHFLFNTNIVLNRDGEIISKYRKINLFIELLVNPSQKPEYVTFTTDFGVTFGHFVCFDIYFQAPTQKLVHQGVKHFVYPTMWFNHVPFITAVQIQLNWAYANNVVLIASNANVQQKGMTGSGIYIGKHGSDNYIVSPKNTTKLLVSKIPKDFDGPIEKTETQITKFSPVEMSVSATPTILINESEELQNGETKICSDKVCCEFDLDYERLDIPEDKLGYEYRFTVWSGLQDFVGLRKGGQAFCAIVFCLENNHETCGQKIQEADKLVDSYRFNKINIKAVVELVSLEDEDYLFMPTTLDNSITPFDVSTFKLEKSEIYTIEGKSYRNYTMKSLKPIQDLLTFGLNGRLYYMDE